MKPSNFPDFVAIEHRMLTYWQENEVFTKLREQISGKPPWSFVDGIVTLTGGARENPSRLVIKPPWPQLSKR